MPYFVRITQTSNRSHDEVRLDLTDEQLRERFLEPYYAGRPIVIGGKTIPPDDIDRMRITYSEKTSDQILPIVREERRRSSVITFTSDEWYIADHGKDVTDEFITGPPGSGVSEGNSRQGHSVQGARVVFVVHGRDYRLRDSMFTFLRALGLHPLEWSEAVLATGKPAPYIGEILDRAFSMASAILVMFTPDDQAVLREDLRERGDPAHETELTPQARPNVIFEAGMAMGRCPDRTLLVEIGNLRPFSDIGGRHTIRLNNSTQRRQELGHRLRAAGAPVNFTGTDWHTAGDFEADVRDKR